MLAIMASRAMAQPSGPTSSSTMPMKPGIAMESTSAQDAVETNLSTKAFKAVDNRMMKAMNHPMTGNTDQDFVAGMLPHHAGAVDMAKVEIRYGKDPEMLRLAHSIIAAQEKEIVQMQRWQALHP